MKYLNIIHVNPNIKRLWSWFSSMKFSIFSISNSYLLLRPYIAFLDKDLKPIIPATLALNDFLSLIRSGESIIIRFGLFNSVKDLKIFKRPIDWSLAFSFVRKILEGTWLEVPDDFRILYISSDLQEKI